jgi:uncharacterized protein (DUF2235 family)
LSRNVVVCCDGTANEFARHNTNVVKLYTTLLHDPARQVTYYHPGLGTMEPAGALTTVTRRATKILGMAVGYGLANDIRDAYVFVMNNFRNGDRLFMFGFSRGAYTVRAVASLLHMYGLIRAGNEPLVPYAIRMMLGIERASGSRARGRNDLSKYFNLARAFRTSMSGGDCRPWFVGVWDTVSSVGWIENPLKLPYVASNPSIEIGRHAIAIDERRAFFRTHLWRLPSRADQERGPRDLKQVWFPGVHCDVGGGYPEAESGLSKVALEWMLDEAQLAGLLVDPARRQQILGEDNGHYVQPNALADLHESLTGAWHLSEYVPKRHFDWQTHREERRMNRYRRRTIPPGSLIHVAARQRGEAYWRERLPENPVWVDKGAPAEPASVLPPQDRR